MAKSTMSEKYTISGKHPFLDVPEGTVCNKSEWLHEHYWPVARDKGLPKGESCYSLFEKHVKEGILKKI